MDRERERERGRGRERVSVTTLLTVCMYMMSPLAKPTKSHFHKNGFMHIRIFVIYMPIIMGKFKAKSKYLLCQIAFQFR